MVLESIKKYNSKNKAKVEKFVCGNTDVIGILIKMSMTSREKDLYFNIKTGKVTHSDGKTVKYRKNYDQKHYLQMLKEKLESRQGILIWCKNQENYSNVLELTFCDGTKINSQNDFDLYEDANGFEDTIIYLIENDALEFSK